ncbi:MAG: ABC transporter ATP-binding protein [Kiritimatiellia bacterium]|nr:ABC transporter ATP-binding protein [Kiritimatiellia bacterium]
MPLPAPPIEIRDLAVSFPASRGQIHVALDGVRLRVDSGRVFGFLGPNGAGKTTLIQVLMGFVAPTSGEVRLLGEDVRRTIARRRVGYLPETPAFYPFLSAREWLILAGRIFGLRGPSLQDRAARLLEEVGLIEAADRRMGTFSRGMLQRIGLAQALINDGDLILLDEPTSGMDPIGRMDIRALIDTWRRAGKTVFFSSHELSEVETVCDEVAILVRGRIRAQGTPEALKRPGESLEQVFIRTVRETEGAGS